MTTSSTVTHVICPHCRQNSYIGDPTSVRQTALRILLLGILILAIGIIITVSRKVAFLVTGVDITVSRKVAFLVTEIGITVSRKVTEKRLKSRKTL